MNRLPWITQHTGYKTLRGRGNSAARTALLHAGAYLLLGLCVLLPPAGAQTPAEPPAPLMRPPAQSQSGPPITITSQDALERARKNDAQYLSAVTNAAIARADRVQAKAALLPSGHHSEEGLVALSAAQLSMPSQSSSSGSSKSVPLTLTLHDALARAQKYSPQFQAAVMATKMARENVVQARSTLLPSADYTTQELITQGNGVTPSGRYVTNDGIHVYRAWGVFHQAFSANTFTLAGYRQATAAEDMARAQQEIARRGLRVVVTQAYYALVVAERQYGTAQESLDQAARSLKISQDLEQGGEVAHSDVITFQIQYNQQHQAFQQAKLAMENNRLALAVMLFPNFNQNFNVVDDLDTTPPLPALEETTKLAEANNQEIRAAMDALHQTAYGVSLARAAFLPVLSFDVDYGIEANAFALRSRAAGFPEAGRLPNLGFFVTASLNVPVWHWGAILSKLRQAKDQRQQARIQLSYTQRQTLKNLYSYYNEARTARDELTTLQSSTSLAAESLRLNTLRYRSGDATVLEVLNAQNTLTAARDSYAAGLARYRVALANLQTLTGSF